MAVNASIPKTVFTAPGARVEYASITTLQTAVARLEAAKANVQNCNCNCACNNGG